MSVTKKILEPFSLPCSPPCAAARAERDVEAPAKKMDVLFIAIDDMNDWTTLFDKQPDPNTEFGAAAGRSCVPQPLIAHPTLTSLRPSTSGVTTTRIRGLRCFRMSSPCAGFQTLDTRDWGWKILPMENGAEQRDFDAFYKLLRKVKRTSLLRLQRLSRRCDFDWGEHDTDKQADEHTVEYVNEVMASHARHLPLICLFCPAEDLCIQHASYRRCQRMISRRPARRWITRISLSVELHIAETG